MKLAILVCLALVASTKGAAILSSPSIRPVSAQSLETDALGLEGIDIRLDTDIRDVRFEGCTRTPCQLVVGRSYLIEVDFVARRSHPSLYADISFHNYFNLESALNVEIPNSAVVAGGLYKLAFTLQPRGQVIGSSTASPIKIGRAHV